MLTTATMMTVVIRLAYAVELPSSGKPELTSTPSGRAMLPKPVRADRCLNNHRIRPCVGPGKSSGRCCQDTCDGWDRGVRTCEASVDRALGSR